MNSINPLHIILLLVVVLMFSISKLHNKQDELQEVQKSFNATKKVALELNALKNVYGSKNVVKRSVERILNSRILSKLEIEKRYKKSSVSIKINSIGLVELNNIMGKFLNSSLNLSTFKIKKLSDKKASLEMEIKW